MSEQAKCEVYRKYLHHEQGASAPIQCGQPATHWYPAAGGGRMNLCEMHAQPHLMYAKCYPQETSCSADSIRSAKVEIE